MKLTTFGNKVSEEQQVVERHVRLTAAGIRVGGQSLDQISPRASSHLCHLCLRLPNDRAHHIPHVNNRSQRRRGFAPLPAPAVAESTSARPLPPDLWGRQSSSPATDPPRYAVPQRRGS